MDIAILSDLHLSNSLPYTIVGDLFRKKKLEEYLSRFFQTIEEEAVDYLVIPGDLCHGTSLDPDGVDLLFFIIEKIVASGIKTIICLGNHDLDQKKSILSFLKRKNKHLYSNIFYNEKQAWNCEFKEISFDIINFCSHVDFLSNAIKAGQQERDAEFSVLIGHIGIKGTLHGTTKSIIGVKKEDIENLSKYYDLIILGHHHKFQWVTEKCFYAGAIQQTRIDEIDTIPGGLIVSLPLLNIQLIENIFSPRFKVIEDYVLIPEDVVGSIVKPVIDVKNKTESENIEFLREVANQDPYYLIKPRLKKSFSIKEGENDYSVANKRVALLKTMKEFELKKKRAKKFYVHTLDLYEKVVGKRKKSV